MKKRVALVALVLSMVVTGACPAQAQPPPTEAQKGLIVAKTFYEMGTFLGLASGRVRLSAVVLAVPSGDRSFTLRLVKPAADEYGSDRIGVIDFQGLRAFSSAISELTEQAQSTALTSVDYLEAFYETNEEVRVGYYQTGSGQTGFLSIGKYSDSSVYFYVSGLTELKALVEKAIAKLGELGAK